MFRNAVLEVIGILTGAILSGVLNKRGYRLAASITLAGSIVLAFFALRSAVKDFFEFGVRYYTETAIVLTLLTAFLFWLYGVDNAKLGAVGHVTVSQQARSWLVFLKEVISETGTHLNSLLGRYKRLANILTALSIVLLIVPLSLSVWPLFFAPTEATRADAAKRQAGAEEAARQREADAARQKQVEDDRKRAEEAERQHKVDGDRRIAEAAQKKAREEEAARQREAERQSQEQEDAQRRAQEAVAQAGADRERQKKLAASPKSVASPVAATLNGFKLFSGIFMWGIGPPPDQRMSYTVKNVEDCSNICRRNASCVGFTYESVSCFVFGRISESRNSASYTSGRR